MPDAPGQPYDEGRREHNLDRPMIVYVEGEDWALGTAHGQAIDLVAPGGSFYMAVETCGPEPSDYCWNAAYDDHITVPAIYDLSDWHYGPHTQAMGTSSAAPYAAGVATLAAEAWRARHGSLPNPAQLEAVLMGSADDQVGPTEDLIVESDPWLDYAWTEWARVDKRGPDAWMGAGRLDASGAIELAER